MKNTHCPSLFLAPNHRRAISLLAPPRNGHVFPSQSIDDCAWEIKSTWARGAANTLTLAGVVYAVWCRLPYGAWTRMWRSERIGFEKRKGEKLRVIGQNLEGVDATISTHLPAAWNTLYHLARIDLEVLKKHIEGGFVHPGTTEGEAKVLWAKFKGQEIPARKAKVALRLRKFAEFVGRTLKDWTPAERELALEELSQVIEQIAGVGLQKSGTSVASNTLRTETAADAALLAPHESKNVSEQSSNALHLL